MQKADGTLLPAAVGTKVGESDTMITGTNGYARLEMTDGGEMVLRPHSRLKVESYRFNADKPAEDKFVFRMLKGGLRTVTGLIGKRGDQDAYEGKTATATVGIRGTQYDMRLCQGDCGALADGTYFAVRFGAVRTGNAQGSLDVAAGQVALVQQAKPPVFLPRDPGIGFTPPAVIPKLDEKKKAQAAAATEAAQPAQEKPEAGSSEKSSPSNTEGGEKQEQEKEQKQEQEQKSESSGQSDSRSDARETSEQPGAESGNVNRESGDSGSDKKTGSDSSKPSGSSSGSSNDASGSEATGASASASGSPSSESGSAPGNPATQGSSAPLQQDAPGVNCSVL